jgi:hypothetical protein
MALSAGCRVIVPGIEACDAMEGTADLTACRRSDIRAGQSTPLVSRSGQLLGMISTYWRKPIDLLNASCSHWTCLPDRPLTSSSAVRRKMHCAKVGSAFDGWLPLWSAVTMQ